MRQIPAETILAAAQNELAGHYFDVVVDGLSLRLRPLTALSRMGKFEMDVLIGTNVVEWYMYIDESADRSALE